MYDFLVQTNPVLSCIAEHAKFRSVYTRDLTVSSPLSPIRKTEVRVTFSRLIRLVLLALNISSIKFVLNNSRQTLLPKLTRLQNACKWEQPSAIAQLHAIKCHATFVLVTDTVSKIIRFPTWWLRFFFFCYHPCHFRSGCQLFLLSRCWVRVKILSLFLAYLELLLGKQHFIHKLQVIRPA